MALKFEKGIVTSPGSTGNQTINLTDGSFGTVKALLMWAVYATADSDTDGNGILSIGAGTYRASTVSRVSFTLFELDGAGTSSSATGRNSGKIMRAFNAVTPTLDYEVDLVSLDNAAFTLNWTDLPTTASIILHYVVLGGADITDALLSSFVLATGAGTQDVTVDTGFGKPDLILAFPIGGGTGNVDGAASSMTAFGVGKDDSNEGHATYFNRNGSATMEMTSHQTDILGAAVASNTTMFYEYELSARSAWPTDGFQINKVTAPGGNLDQWYLALRGTFRSVIGSGTAPIAGTPPVTQDISMGTTPRGGLFFHNSVPTNAGASRTDADLDTFGIGATDGTAEGWAGIGNDDGNTTSIAHRNQSTAKTVKMYTPSASGTLASEADGLFSGQNVRLSWNDIDSVAREYRYLLLGDAPNIDAQPGAYTVTGTDATLSLGRSLSSDAGAYTFSGVLAALLAARMVSSDPGAYTFTGVLASLLTTRLVSADPGVFAVTGFDTDLVYVPATGDFELDAAMGTYLLSGTAAELVADRLLEADPAAYVLTGFDTDFGQARIPILPAGENGYIADYGRGRIREQVLV